MKKETIFIFVLIVLNLIVVAFVNKAPCQINNKIEPFLSNNALKSKISGFVETGIPLFRVSSYIEKSSNLATVNQHIIDNNLNTDAKRIRYLEQLERQLKLNEDQIAEDPDFQVDSVGVPIADYETNLKKRYERELQRLSETEVVYKPVIDKAAMQVQREVEEPVQQEVQDVSVEVLPFLLAP